MEIDTDHGSPAPMLWPEEAAALGPCVESRRREFARGRACARRAVAALGLGPQPILRKGRAPAWPAPVVGSITHCSGFVAAAVLPAAVARGIGIDAEVRGRVSDHLAARVAATSELAHRPADIGAADLLTFLWCAKEAVFKCLHPICGVFVDFLDIELAFGSGRRFYVSRVNLPSVAPLAATLRGAIAATELHVFAACLSPRGRGERAIG